MEGDQGDSCGLVHINKNYYPEEFKNCYDDMFSLRFAAKLIADGRESQFTSCNCFQFVRIFTPKLPRLTKDVKPNTTISKGVVAIFSYKGVPHYATVTALGKDTFTVREAHFQPCKTGTREIKYNDKNIKGFYSPTSP